jgi:hypothetical protein
MCPHDQLLAVLQVPEPNVVFNRHIQTVETTVVALAELVPQAVAQVAENEPACVTIILVPVVGVGLVFQVIVPPTHPLAVKVKLVAGGQRVVVPDGEMVGATGAILFVTIMLVVAVQPFAPVAFTT